VLEKNSDTVKVVFKHFPLRNHKMAQPAAVAAMAAHDQGKFWEYHDLVFKNYRKLNDKLLDQFAVDAGLDKAAFDAKRKDPELLQMVQQDYKDGVAVGLRGTPTIYVNGRLVKNRSLQGFQALIDKELKKQK